MAREKRFKADHSYEIGVLKSGARLDSDTPQFIRSGGLGPKTLLGSQLIERGVETLEDFFKKNPFNAPARKTFHLYEISPDGMERTPFGAATIMPEENDTVEHSLGDEDSQPSEEPRVTLFEQPAPRYDPTNEMVDVLRGQLTTRDQQIDALVGAVNQSHRLAEHAMMQTERSMEKINEMLEHVQRANDDRERIARESAENSVTIKNLLELREREHEWQTKEKELENAARERERALEKQVEEKSKSTLGDSVQTFLSDYSQYLGPALQHLMLSLAKSMTGGQQQGMQPEMMFGGGMPMMPGGGMPGSGMPGGAMPGMSPAMQAQMQGAIQYQAQQQAAARATPAEKTSEMF